MSRVALPPPWRGPKYFHVGGIQDIGFAPSSDWLFILSADGAGLFNCVSGELLARDRDPSYPFDEAKRLAPGLGPLQGAQIELVGIHGGALPQATDDKWLISTRAPAEIVIQSPARDATFVVSDLLPGVRAFGFSPTGRSMVIATGGEAAVFTRD